MLGKGVCLAERKAGIRTSLLSQTFRDAIAIARELDIRYLWIDSLCIIQDDVTDWEAESAKMSSIYRLSIVTIAAATRVAESPRGFFKATPELSIRESWEITPLWPEEFEANEIYYPKDRSWSTDCAGLCTATFSSSSSTDGVSLHFLPKVPGVPHDKIASASPPFDRTSNVFVRRRAPVVFFIEHGSFNERRRLSAPPDHLSSRAWTYQERLLATHVLHYTATELVWECKTTIRCQCSLIEQMDFPKVSIQSNSLKSYLEDQKANAGSVEELVSAWMRIVFHYSARFLSYPSDRLPALSGLAKSFQERGTLGEYVAGLWSSHLGWGGPPVMLDSSRQAWYPSIILQESYSASFLQKIL